MLVALLRWLILILAAAPLVYYVAAMVCAWFFFRRQRAADVDFLPPVSILKPLCGLDRETYRNLSSFCQQHYPRYEILFGVDNERDAAVPLIHRLMADFPRIPIRLLIGPPGAGANNKVTKLCRLARESSYDLLVASDSDIRVEPDYLRRVAAPFADDRVGAVTCLYRGITAPNLWSRLEDLNLTADFLPGVLVARRLGVRFTLGATMAIRRQLLARIGGFEALVDAAADDHELGSRVAALGYRVEVAGATVETECSSWDFHSFFEHQVRWAVVTRHSEPWGHLGFIFAQGLPWTVAAALAAPSRMMAIGYALAYLGLRTAMGLAVGAWGLKDSVLKRKWWLLPFSDALSFLVWTNSLFRERIEWRGGFYTVKNGQLVLGAGKEEFKWST